MPAATYDSRSPDQTMAIAAEFARSLRGGECIALHGDLGAGKTQFVRGLLQGLGGDGRAVSSPIIRKEVSTRSPPSSLRPNGMVRPVLPCRKCGKAP